MRKKEKVKAKFEGLCAYTGKQLDDNWEIDHVISRSLFNQVVVKEAHYKNHETGEELSYDSYWELHNKTKAENGYFSEEYGSVRCFVYVAQKTKPHKDCDNIENLLPAIGIINHYKRGFDIEGFRERMTGFHIRLGKLPKKTSVEKTKKRIIYMNTIAELFGITPEKPFNGKFYFETCNIVKK